MKNYSYKKQNFFVHIIFAISILLYGCSEDTIKVPSSLPSPQMIVFGEIAPVKIFFIIEPQTIRIRVTCTVAQDYEFIEFRYRHPGEKGDSQLQSLNSAPCIPGTILYETSPEFALPLSDGQELIMTTIVHYRNGSTGSMHHTYLRSKTDELILKD
jgi:hypothetical protein